MKRFVVSSGWALLGLAALAAATAGDAMAGSSRRQGIPGIGPGTGVDVYIPNPDPQTPIAWSQGTEPPPPQGDYGGGVLQYMITGNESRPAPTPRVPPPYYPARVAPLQGPGGRSDLATHARPPEGYARGGYVQGGYPQGGYAPPVGYARPAYAQRPAYGYARPGYAPMSYDGAAPGFYPAPGYDAAPQGYLPQAYAPQGYGQRQAYAGAQAYAAPQAEIDPVYRRQEVAYAGGQSPGTVVIDTANKFLYLVEGGGHALRYGIGVAKPGFLWSGSHTITRKAEWPDWTPPAEMLGRRPDLPRHMEGGLQNPLGARAMYLGSTLYRIHGTNEPNTIGTNVSSGCIRLVNEDVEDLYGRVHVGTRVVVI